MFNLPILILIEQYYCYSYNKLVEMTCYVAYSNLRMFLFLFVEFKASFKLYDLEFIIICLKSNLLFNYASFFILYLTEYILNLSFYLFI